MVEGSWRSRRRVVRRCATKWRVAWSHTVLTETPLRRDCRSCLPTGLYQLCRKKYDSALRGQLPPFWKRRVGEMERGWKKTREGRRRRGRIEQDQDPPRSNLALSHVRVIPFHPADQISPHLDSAYFAPCSARPIATKPNTTVRHSLLFHHFRPRKPVLLLLLLLHFVFSNFSIFVSIDLLSFFIYLSEKLIRFAPIVSFYSLGTNIVKGRERRRRETLWVTVFLGRMVGGRISNNGRNMELFTTSSLSIAITRVSKLPARNVIQESF